FDLSDDVNVTEYDGRAFLTATGKKYDVIQVVAYQDINIPFQMSSVEFFKMVKEHLKPGGVMTVNMNMHSDGEESINSYLCDTIASVFEYVFTADVPGNTNRELFACVDASPADMLESGISGLNDRELKDMMRNVSTRLTEYKPGDNILTDDRAPVEVLGMRAIDALIASEVEYYRNIYERNGLKGLIAALA
ncbi:MAG: fused MFS/spermidine synthase, partial [Oscillospiraceae bacterium]|nr:fused MFS/spermidine synthase [Oscillospiraceae bacterium]